MMVTSNLMIYTGKSSFIQVSLHREPPEVGLVEQLTGNLYWWVELCVPILHRIFLYSFSRDSTEHHI